MCLAFLKLTLSFYDLKWAFRASAGLHVPDRGVASVQIKRMVKGPDQPLSRESRSALCFRASLTRGCTEQCSYAAWLIKDESDFFGTCFLLANICDSNPLDLSRLLYSWCERKDLTTDLEDKSLSWLNHEHPVITNVGDRIAAFVQTDTFKEKVQDNDESSKYSSCLSLCKEASVLK